MIIFPQDPILGGIVHDTHRRDVLLSGGGADTFVLKNDGRTDTVWGFQDGIDRIDISALDASWDQLMVRQISMTEYMIFYLQEERLRVVFEEPLPDFVPADGMLLDEGDFVFRAGLPDATPQLIVERSLTENEVILGTTLPDVFVFEPDGQRDTIRRFEPGKDLIDLAAYGTTFGELELIERKEGRIAIKVPVGEEDHDWLVVIDISRQLTETDITADMFVF